MTVPKIPHQLETIAHPLKTAAVLSLFEYSPSIVFEEQHYTSATIPFVNLPRFPQSQLDYL